MSINRNLANFATSITSDGKAYITITVTVASVGGGNRYHFDGTSQQILSLSKGITYRFDTSSSSVSGHPLRFSTTSNGTHNSGSQFTTGITTVGSAGSAGSYVQVTLEQDAPDHLYSYCQYHANMGALVKNAPIGDPNFASFAGTFTFPTSDGSANQVLKTDGSGTLSFVAQSSGYANSDVDSHLNQSNPTSGYVLSWNGSDYAWVSNAGYTDANVNTHLNVSGASSGQILGWNGSDYAWVDDQSGSGGIASLAADTTPQLGGNLDVQTNSIVSTSNRDIAITPNGTGKVVLDGLSYPQADGSADQVLKTDGSGNLSFVAQASGSSLNATASGSLANGDMVVVNADGTVSVVADSTKTFNAGAVGTFSTSAIRNDSTVTYDTTVNKVIAIYTVGTDIKASLGTVSGTSISFANEVTVRSGHICDYLAAAFDPNSGATVVTYRKQGGAPFYWGAKALQVSGTTISVGSEANLLSAQVGFCDITIDTNLNKFVFAAMDFNGYGLKVNVATVSGTTLTIGSAQTVHNTVYDLSLTFDSGANKVLLAYRDGANNAYGAVRVLTVSSSANSVSYAGATYFSTTRSDSPRLSYDATANKTFVIYTDYGNNEYETIQAGTVSGTSTSWGSKVVVGNFSSNGRMLQYDASSANTALILRRSSDLVEYYPITISGTTPVVGSASTVLGASDAFANYGRKMLAVDSSSNQIVAVFQNGDDSDKGEAFLVRTPFAGSTNLTSENYIGVSDAVYASGATATIQVAGAVDNAQSGLTAGQTYYVQNTGGIGLSASTPQVVAGTAISATELAINPDTNPTAFGTPQVDAHLNISSASSGQILSWNGSDYAWTADGGGLNVVSSHSKTLSSNATIAATDNAMSVGPLTVANGVTLTISSGARYVVV